MRRTPQGDLPPPWSIRRQLQSLQVAMVRRGRLAYTSLEREGLHRVKGIRDLRRATRNQRTLLARKTQLKASRNSLPAGQTRTDERPRAQLEPHSETAPLAR